ncbi:MAG: ABC transporter substrate-binding protein [Kofleriaceae bacterium]
MEAELIGRLAAVALAYATVAHAETRPHYGGTVDASLLGAPVSLDPVAVASHAELTVTQLVFDNLYRLDGRGQPQPHLAEGPPVLDATQRVATIAIRRGIALHDGSLLSAQDVAASLERARTGQARLLLAQLASVRATSDAVEITLRAPSALLPTWLALPQTAVTKHGKAPGERPVGSGPFAFEALDRTRRRLTLRAFELHFAGRPYLDRLTLHWFDTPDGEVRQFETGNVHLSSRGVAAFAGAQPKFRAAETVAPPAILVFAGFGHAHADVLGDRAFRRALDHALVRDSLTPITSGEQVEPTREPVPAQAGGATLAPAGRAGDLVAAQAALADAATRVRSLAPAQRARLKLEILVEDTRPDDREFAGRLVRALQKLGISAVISAVSASTHRDRIARGTTDLWIGQLASPISSAQIWWSAAFAAGNDDWAATHAFDPAALRRAFAERLPIVPLVFRGIRLSHRTDVRGLVFDASARPCFAEVFLFGAPVTAKGKP